MLRKVSGSFPAAKMTSSNVLFRLQPKDIKFTVAKKQENVQISELWLILFFEYYLNR